MASCTKTVVFTDLVGYTNHTATISRQDLEQLAQEHEEHTLRVFAPYGGELVKSIGDSYMAVFSSATDALKACLDLVSKPLPDRGMFFRASAATGDVQEINNDYFGNRDFFGEAVNLSARINSVTPAGEVWFANRTRVCMTQSEVAWESVGLHTFKGIAEKEMCYRAVHKEQCILGEEVERILKQGSYHIVQTQSDTRGVNTSVSNIFLLGHQLGSPEMIELLRSLSNVPSGNIWLVVYNIPTAERLTWSAKGHHLIVGNDETFLKTLTSFVEENSSVEHSGANSTVMIDLDNLGDVTLGLVGVALPNVPMVGMIQGYSLDLLQDGNWGYNQNKAIVQVDISPQALTLTSFKPGVHINSESTKPGEPTDLTDGSMFRVRDWVYRYISNIGSIYKGIIIGNAVLQMQFNAGDEVEIGRVPSQGGLTLPDRGGVDRIRWIRGPKAEDAKKRGLTLDRTLTGRQHAKFTVVLRDLFVISPLHPRLQTFVIRKGSKKMERVKERAEVDFGDLIIVGTHVLSLSKLF
jgi:hypothetical protein